MHPHRAQAAADRHHTGRVRHRPGARRTHPAWRTIPLALLGFLLASTPLRARAEPPLEHCAMSVDTQVSPRRVAPGDTVTVDIRLDYLCPLQSSERDHVILMIGTVAPRGSALPTLARNLRIALSGSLNFFASIEGARVDVVYFGDAPVSHRDVFARPAPSGAGAAFQLPALVEGDATPGWKPALAEAARLFDETPDALGRRLLMIDLGAGGGLREACVAPWNEQVQAAVIELPAAQGRNLGCANYNHVTLDDPNAEGLADVSDPLSFALAFGDRPAWIHIALPLSPELAALVPDSISPPPTSQSPEQLVWSFPQNCILGYGDIHIQLRLQIPETDGIAPRVGPLGPSASARFVLGSHRPDWRLDLTLPEVCIHRPGRSLEDCAALAPDPSPSPTVEPSATPLPASSPTPPRVYLPRLQW
ncbi:MAG: hypothetical protein KDH92_01500 [Chloroflexi bacterium]|nr:hypothetical protein [Chloroflexota bacterium]